MKPMPETVVPAPKGRHSARIFFYTISAALMACILVAGPLVYRFSCSHARRDVQNDLEMIAALKADQISDWYGAYVNDMRVLSAVAFARTHVLQYVLRGGTAADRDEILKWMETRLAFRGYKAMILLDTRGRTVLRVPETGDAQVYAHQVFQSAIETGEIASSDFYRDPVSGEVYLDLIVPFRAPGGAAGAVLVLRLDASEYLFPLIKKWPVTSESGETLLVRREGNEAVFLNDLRFAQNAALSLRFPVDDRRLPAAMAAGGRQGFLEGWDYRGKKVLAYTRPIPGTPWFIVAKLDADEAYRYARWNAVLALFMLSMTSFVGLALAGLGWYRQRYHAEQERNALIEHYAYLTRYANDIILLMDEDLRVIEANERACQTYGYTLDKIKGMHMGGLHPAEDATFLHGHVSAMKNAEGGILFESMHRRRDGTVFPVEVSARRFLIDGKKFCQCIIRDITERRDAAEKILKLNLELEGKVAERTEQLRAANDDLSRRALELESSNRELEAFSYAVSHDLRAPLRSIDGFSQALLEDCGDKINETGREDLDRIRAASQRMGMLIDDLLKLSRVSRGEMCYEPVDLSGMAAQVAAELQGMEPGRGAEFAIQPGMSILGDPHLFRVVLNNLLGNAWKFTGHRQYALIEFGAAAENGRTVFYVRDNGAGFDMRYTDKLFGAFQRLHKLSEFPGTGIGLATVQRIVRRHGGRIWAEAEVDKGATFYFEV